MQHGEQFDPEERASAHEPDVEGAEGWEDEDAEAEAESVGSIDIGPGTIDPSEFQVPRRPVSPDYYVAVLLLRTTSEEEGHRPLYEESFVLLKAESAEEAETKAGDLAKQQQTTYRDENHTLVTWKLERVLEVKPLEDSSFDDGTELYSRLFRDYRAYRAFEPHLDGEL
ncbi:hypothetical protein GCM10027174_02180 [Salinifilum aidingensis]